VRAVVRKRDLKKDMGDENAANGGSSQQQKACSSPGRARAG